MSGTQAAKSASAAPRAAELVFVVGVSRSGTTLLRSILNGHPEIAIAPENHFLGHLLPSEGVRQQLRRLGDLGDDRTLDGIVRFVYDGGLERSSRWRDPSRFWTWLRRTVPPAELRERLLRAERSERGIFESLLRAYADHKGRRIAGEKTPAHLRYVETLLGWFPEGRAVHMMRDPRAIFVSEVRRRRMHPGGQPYRWLVRVPALLAAFMAVQTAAAWAEAARRARRNARRFPDRFRIVRFEDLVRDPEATTRDLCTFLGVEFDPAMLQQEVVSMGTAAGRSGFDREAASRWRTAISPLADRWFRLVLGGDLRTHGYGP